MSATLKPCPFCHGNHITDRHFRDGRQMFCQSCGASVAPTYHGPNNDTLPRAIAAWNRRADVWHPIESAPKDGTIVDLWHPEWGRRSDCYWGLPQHCCGEAGSYCDSDWHSLEAGWVDSALNHEAMDADEITHWMPLPSPPSHKPSSLPTTTGKEAIA